MCAPVRLVLFSTFLCLLSISSQVLLVNAEITVGPDGKPQVEVYNGKLGGRWQLSRNTVHLKEREFSSFEGIPYAKPPERFQVPEPATNWSGVRDATFTRAVCPQLEGINQAYHDTTEDCLFLNVYVPKLATAKVLPTMFWIHGGGFMDGAGSYLGPHYFMQQDVILVTTNYRLGALGFLNTGDKLVEGNMGLKDMILALKWVQQNIKAFGGDPGKVTLFGESAGGAAVHLLMISPAAEGLFQKVIAQSGTALCPWAVIRDHVETSQGMAKELNCDATTSAEIVDCLKKKSIKDILVTQQKFMSFFGPTIDTTSTSTSILPDTPMNLVTKPLENGSAKVPLIIGFNQKEGLMNAAIYLKQPDIVKQLNENWMAFIPAILGYNHLNSTLRDEISNEIRDFYLPGVTEISFANLENFTNLFTDFYFYNGVKQTALLHATYNDQVYPYKLVFKGKFSLINMLGMESQGPVHADDLQYLFDSLLGPKKNWDDLVKESKDEEFSYQFINLWNAFAREGVPSKWGEEWIPLQPRENTVLATPVSWYNLDTSPKHVPESAFETSRLEFWDKVFPSGNSANRFFSQSLGLILTIILVVNYMLR